MQLLVSIFIFAIIGNGCTQQQAKTSPIPEPIFVQLYADRMVLHEEGKIQDVDSLSQERHVDSVYRYYNVDRVQFQQTIEFYKQDLHRWKSLHDLVAKRLEELQQKESTSPTLDSI